MNNDEIGECAIESLNGNAMLLYCRCCVCVVLISNEVNPLDFHISFFAVLFILNFFKLHLYRKILFIHDGTQSHTKYQIRNVFSFWSFIRSVHIWFTALKRAHTMISLRKCVMTLFGNRFSYYNDAIVVCYWLPQMCR